MKKATHRILSAVLAAVISFSVVFIGATKSQADTSKDSTVQGLEDQLRYLEEKAAEAQSRLYNLSGDIYDQQVYAEQLNILIATVQDKIKIADELITALEDSKAQLEADIIQAEADFERTFDEFLGVMRMTYEEGEVSYLSLIFGAESLVDFLTQIDKVTSMLAYNKKLMADYKSAKETLDTKKRECEEAIEKQNETIAELEKTRSDNVALLNNAELYIKQLTMTKEQYSAELYAYQQAWSEANAKLTEYLAELARKSKSQYNQEGFCWPMDKDRYYIMSSGYGWRYIFGAQDFHIGIDICGYYCENAEIHASASGTVVIADHNGSSSYGKYVVIDHGSGIMTLYAHCNLLYVNVGDWVNQGDVISLCGSTGRVTGPHLHFEYRINGQTYNPLDYINIPDTFVDASG